MSSTVLVSNLSLSIDSSMLEDMFSLVGNVRKAVIQFDAATGLSRGFGFVEMSTSEEARNCVLHFDGQKKEGSTLMVREEKFLARKQSEFSTSVRQPPRQKTLRTLKRNFKVGKI